MQPVQLPRAEFALCKIAKWALYRLHDGRVIAHRAPFETVRKGKIFKHEPMYIEWPSDAGDVPPATRLAFDEAFKSCTAGIQ